MSAQNKEETKIKNPTLRILLGIVFMIVGILWFFYPEYTGVRRTGSVALVSFLGLVLFFAGLAEVIYIVWLGKGRKIPRLLTCKKQVWKGGRLERHCVRPDRIPF